MKIFAPNSRLWTYIITQLSKTVIIAYWDLFGVSFSVMKYKKLKHKNNVYTLTQLKGAVISMADSINMMLILQNNAR